MCTQRDMLTPRRLPCDSLRRYEDHLDLHAHRHGRPQPLPRHRVRCCRWAVYSPRGAFHRHTTYQTKVSEHSAKPVSSTKGRVADTRIMQETRRPLVPQLEHRPTVLGNYNRSSAETRRDGLKSPLRILARISLFPLMTATDGVLVSQERIGRTYGYLGFRVACASYVRSAIVEDH